MSGESTGPTNNNDLVQMRPDKLEQIWSSYPDKILVIGFYSHNSSEYRTFSNFFQHDPVPYEIPECCGKLELISSGRSSSFTFTCGEKAIMLCKACVMGDFDTYDAILSETIPRKIKAFGRKVKPWDQEKWNRVVCTIAFTIVLAKARTVTVFREVLLSTGSSIIAEATRNDKNWGIGIDMGKEDVQFPKLWKGTNILGWALMEARNQLQAQP